MKFIEVLVDTGEDYYKRDRLREVRLVKALINIGEVCFVKQAKARVWSPEEEELVREGDDIIHIDCGADDFYVHDKGYEEMKRLIISGGNLIATGTTKGGV